MKNYNQLLQENKRLKDYNERLKTIVIEKQSELNVYRRDVKHTTMKGSL